MVMFDLSGTTVYDDTGVRDCLYKAAEEHHLDATPDEILLHMGTNKIHLYDARHLQMAVDFLTMTRDVFPFKDIEFNSF